MKTPLRCVVPYAASLAGPLLTLALSGCGGGPEKIEQVHQPIPVASPAVRGSENGLELAWWVTPANTQTLAEAIDPYRSNPVPLDARTRALWESNGLRVVAVPLQSLSDVRSHLPVIGAIQRQWLGQVPIWTDTIRGPAWSGEQTIALDSGRLTLGAGRLRLLSRCWTIPVPLSASGSSTPTGAELHIEFLIQHQELAAQQPQNIGTELQPADPQEEGLVFRRLGAVFDAPQGFAYLLIPEAPGTDWDRKGAGPSSPDGSGAESADAAKAPSLGHIARPRAGDAPEDLPTQTSGSSGPIVSGPPPSPTLTVGQALLTSGTIHPSGSAVAAGTAPRQTRAILIIIPRVPQRFRLLPD
jgi:hypothetical protein